MARTPQPRQALAERPSVQVQAWTARAHGLRNHPRLTSYIAQHGRWPSFVGRWGRTRPLDAGGWAARLLDAVHGELAALQAVTITFPPATRTRLATLRPAEALAEALGTIAPGMPSSPILGALRAEWTPVQGWHLEGMVSTADIARLEAHPLGLDVQGRPLADLDTFRRQVMYTTKGLKRNAPGWQKAEYAEYFLTLMADLEASRLPSTLTLFGVGNHELGPSPMSTPPSKPSRTTKAEQARALFDQGQTRAQIAAALGVSPRTVTRWLRPEASSTPSFKPTSAAPAAQASEDVATLRATPPDPIQQQPEAAAEANKEAPRHDQTPQDLQTDHCMAGHRGAPVIGGFIEQLAELLETVPPLMGWQADPFDLPRYAAELDPESIRPAFLRAAAQYIRRDPEDLRVLAALKQVTLTELVPHLRLVLYAPQPLTGRYVPAQAGYHPESLKGAAVAGRKTFAPGRREWAGTHGLVRDGEYPISTTLAVVEPPGAEGAALMWLYRGENASAGAYGHQAYLLSAETIRRSLLFLGDTHLLVSTGQAREYVLTPAEAALLAATWGEAGPAISTNLRHAAIHLEALLLGGLHLEQEAAPLPNELAGIEAARSKHADHLARRVAFHLGEAGPDTDQASTADDPLAAFLVRAADHLGFTVTPASLPAALAKLSTCMPHHTPAECLMALEGIPRQTGLSSLLAFLPHDERVAVLAGVAYTCAPYLDYPVTRPPLGQGQDLLPALLGHPASPGCLEAAAAAAGRPLWWAEALAEDALLLMGDHLAGFLASDQANPLLPNVLAGLFLALETQ